ncbi:MAG: hypothetical protein IKY04_00485, partial [Lachnospiraceae bacterium]|nr:hypothetical protein [Lachnospiraceae bacterium]
IIILTALGSSLVLSGFAMIMCAGIHWIALLAKKEKARARFTFFGGVTLALTFILCNLSLIKQILGIGAAGYASHKDEYTLVGKSILDTFADMLLKGAEHSGFERLPILILVAVSVLYFGTFKKENADVRIRFIRQIFFALIFISLGTAVYESNALAGIRESIGGAFKWFQVSRLDWLAPAMILVMLALTFEHVITRLSGAKEDESKIFTRGLMLLGVIVYIFTFATFLLNDTWKDNAKVILGRDPALLSWDEYYATDILPEAEAFIKETNGEDKSEYKCVSLGMSPAAALYNGFNCLDGYSNNYDVEYKHEFRKIIAGELDKNDYIKAYFDEWGNRCYIYSAQIPGYFTVEKGGFYFSDIKIDVGAFKAMGGKYIFSAAYIDNAESQGLKLLNEEPISTDKSYYQIYIYEAQ